MLVRELLKVQEGEVLIRRLKGSRKALELVLDLRSTEALECSLRRDKSLKSLGGTLSMETCWFAGALQVRGLIRHIGGTKKDYRLYKTKRIRDPF